MSKKPKLTTKLLSLLANRQIRILQGYEWLNQMKPPHSIPVIACKKLIKIFQGSCLPVDTHRNPIVYLREKLLRTLVHDALVGVNIGITAERLPLALCGISLR